MEKEKIIEIAKGIRVIKPFTDEIIKEKRYAVYPVMDPINQSCIWEDTEACKEAFIVETYDTFEAHHTFGYASLFKPSLGEIIESMPAELIGKCNAVSIKLKDTDYDKFVHISIVTPYLVNFRDWNIKDNE